MDNLIIFLAKYLIFIIGFIAFGTWLFSKAKTRWQLGLSVFLAAIIAVILGRLAAKLYFHPRPFIVDGAAPLIAHGNNNGFPSDHTLAAATLATVVYFYRRRLGIILMFLALLVGLGRVWAHVHWPVDIAGSLIIGAFAGWAGYQLVRRSVPKNEQSTIYGEAAFGKNRDER